ncbi:MAG: Gfo/Idh/MocA family oxidoreductase [Oscillospiraceae bacterium]|nr:Gfo/Idh/MocA family oxidoreductase [Oscillospiraceae bacterium]
MDKTVNVGVIGLGGRGYNMLRGELLKLDYVNVTAVCDFYEDRMENGQKAVQEVRGYTPFGTTDYKEIIDRDDVDMVLIFTAWESHVDIAVASMKAGKYTGLEVGGAYCVEDCWKLVDTQEETGTPFMFLENCCYGEKELLVMNMVKQGLFGEIVYCEGGYCHDLRGEVAGGKENRHYRLRNYLTRNCENYPTHDLGPISKLIGINRGNRLTSLTSFSSASKGMHSYILENKADDKELLNATFAQGDIIKTFITCENGETIVLTLDTTLPRCYSRQFTVRGTKGMYMEDINAVFLDSEHHQYHEHSFNPLWDNAKEYKEKYHHPLWGDPEKLYGQGHGGMDFLVLSAMFDSYFNNTHPPVDVYDAAAWMCVTALSEISIKEGNKKMDFPDFTRGKYLDRKEHSEGLFSLEF